METVSQKEQGRKRFAVERTGLGEDDMGGGPDKRQTAAADSQVRLNDQTAAIAGKNQQLVEDQFNKISPFATSRLNNGLPFAPAMTDFSSGTNAQAFAPGRAQLKRSLARFGTAPSGFATQALSDFDTNRAHAFDSDIINNQLTNEQAKGEAARVLTGQQQVANPLGYTSAAMQGNQSVMQAPLQKAGLGGLLGGAISGAVGAASKIPF
jgi:hypothetical protein